jgi:hypothetical protein
MPLPALRQASLDPLRPPCSKPSRLPRIKGTKAELESYFYVGSQLAQIKINELEI